MTADAKTAFVLIIVSCVVPSAVPFLISIFNSETAALFFLAIAIFVLAPSLVCLILFWYGVLSGKRDFLKKGKQWPYWIAIGCLLAISFTVAGLLLLGLTGQEPSKYAILLLLLPIAACGYPEGRICALRKNSKWIAILPTLAISLFFTVAIILAMILNPPTLG